jgi:hypothetical protein
MDYYYFQIQILRYFLIDWKKYILRGNVFYRIFTPNDFCKYNVRKDKLITNFPLIFIRL